ncbi:MAG: hypothetical protein KHX36_09090 [Clostridiales bacterium]|nr:hypothetical protein [Clostridiales bacterium]
MPHRYQPVRPALCAMNQSAATDTINPKKSGETAPRAASTIAAQLSDTMALSANQGRTQRSAAAASGMASSAA